MGLHENLRNEPVSRLALREAITVPPEMLLRDVVARMREKGLGCVIVVDQQSKPLGMFTEGILRHLLVESRGALFVYRRLGRPVFAGTDCMVCAAFSLCYNRPCHGQDIQAGGSESCGDHRRPFGA